MEDTRLAAARALLAVARTDAALDEVHRVLAGQPEDVDAWCLLAMCHRRAGDLPNALAAAGRAVALDPGREWAHRVHAEMLRKSGRYADAVAAARRAVSLAPLEWRTQVNLVHCLLDAGDTGAAQARDPMARALALAPQVPDAHVLAGRVHARLGENDQARECWARALALDPGNTAAQGLLARDALARGRTAEGIAALRATVGADPTDPAVPATVARIGTELVWRAARWSALGYAVLVAAMVVLAGTGLRAALTPAALVLGAGAQVLWLRGYPGGWRALRGDARRGPEVLRLGLLCLALQPLTLVWAGLAPVHPGPLTIPAYALVALILATPLVWLLGEPGRPAIRPLYRLLRRARR